MISTPMLDALINRGRFREYWLVWVLCGSLLAIDFFARFIPDEFIESGSYKPVAQEEFSVLELGSDALERYLLKLSKYQEVKLVALEEPELTEAPVNLGSWVGSDYSYQLLAVFSAGNAFAVVSRLSFETKEQDIVELQVGDSMSGYSVSSVTQKGITLAGPNGEREELRLFVPSVDEWIRSGLTSEPPRLGR